MHVYVGRIVLLRCNMIGMSYTTQDLDFPLLCYLITRFYPKILMNPVRLQFRLVIKFNERDKFVNYWIRLKLTFV